MERELVSVLERWEDSGAVWHALEVTPSLVTVGLYRCDGGEEVERLTSSDPETVAFVVRRTSGETPL